MKNIQTTVEIGFEKVVEINIDYKYDDLDDKENLLKGITTFAVFAVFEKYNSEDSFDLEKDFDTVFRSKFLSLITLYKGNGLSDKEIKVLEDHYENKKYDFEYDKEDGCKLIIELTDINE